MGKNNLGKNIVVISSTILLLIVGAGFIGNIEKKFDDMPVINSVLNGTSSEDNRQEDNSSDNVNDSSNEIVNYNFSLVGTMNEWDVTNNEYKLIYSSTDEVYTITLDNVVKGTEFKIVNNNSYDYQYGYENLDESSKSYVSSDTENICINGNADHIVVVCNPVKHNVKLNVYGWNAVEDENTNSSENGDTSNEEEFVSQHHFTIVGSMNEWDVTNNDYVFTTTDDITFTLNADLEYLSEWKIANNNAWDWQYCATNLTENSKNFGQDSNGNIKIVVSGNYDITLNIQLHTIELTYISALETE